MHTEQMNISEKRSINLEVIIFQEKLFYTVYEKLSKKIFFKLVIDTLFMHASDHSHLLVSLRSV